MKQPITFQDLLRRKHQKLFVGRQNYLSFFEKNLVLTVEDERRRSIIGISGQAGVGKSSLLERFRRLADSAKAITALTDESQRDIPSVLDTIAKQLERQGHGPSFKAFKETYKLFRQRRQELEADPEMPKGLSAIAGRAVVKTGLSFVRSAPLGNVIAELIDEDSLATQVAEWGAYVARKIKDKDEVGLLKDPVGVLTPLVLEAFESISKETLIVLLFDTYERTHLLLAPWLNDLMKGKYGDLPADILFVIAGQQPLDRNQWIGYEGLIHRINLEPFTEQEARDYISRQGIVDEPIITTILALTGRLPLLVATLAAESPKDATQLGSPTGVAILRFLKWVETDQQRELALNAAIPRTLNQDVLRILVDRETLAADFNWLRAMPFVQERHDGWIYHDVVRSQMLRQKRSESPEGWAATHYNLAAYYHQLVNNLSVTEGKAHVDPKWRLYSREALYHQLCHGPQKELNAALNGFIEVYSNSKDFAVEWAETILAAGRDSEASELLEWGERLLQCMKFRPEFDPAKVIESFTLLIDSNDIEERLRGELYYRRGEASLFLGNFKEATEDFDRAVTIKSDDLYYWLGRALNSFLMGQHDRAKADLAQARHIEPDSHKPLVLLACIHYYTGNKREAVETLSASSVLKPEVISLIALLVEFFTSQSPIAEYIARASNYSSDVNSAIQSLQQFDEHLPADHKFPKSSLESITFLSDFVQEANKSMSIASPNFIHVLFNVIGKSTLFKHAVQSEVERDAILEKLESFAYEREAWQTAISAVSSLLPAIYFCIPPLVLLRVKSKQYDDALFILDNAIVVYPRDPEILKLRIEVFIQLGRYEEALADTDDVLGFLDEQDVEYLVQRGLLLTYIGRYAEAIETYTKALIKEPDDFAIPYNIAVAAVRLEGIPSAAPFIEEASIMLVNLLQSERRDLALYGLGGLEAVKGNHETALDHLQEAINLNTGILEFVIRDVAWLDLRTDDRFKQIVSIAQVRTI